MGTYFDDPANLDEAVLYLRNKNILLVEDAPRLVDRVLRRLSHVATAWRHHALRTGWGVNGKLVISEQVVENAWVLSQLAPDDLRILDFGGVESVLPIQLSAFGKEVWVLDARRYPFTHPRLQSVQADILAGHLPFTGSFDVVLSISTIEHVGLSRYGDSPDPDGDRRAVEALWAAVRPGGRLLATVPAGRPVVQRGYRVYDESRIREVFPYDATIRWFHKEGRQGTWQEATSEEVSGIVYEAPTAEAPVEAVALIAAVKSPAGRRALSAETSASFSFGSLPPSS